MNNTIVYKGYVIDIHSSTEVYQYTIKKDKKMVVESIQGFPFPSEAEIHAKMYIDRMIGKIDGWIVT
jgi:hypothetical protein